MKKILFCGNINSEWDILIDRVVKLQSSAHGPFDGLFCVGTFFQSEDEFFDISSRINFPIPTFVLDRTGYSDDFNPPRNVHFFKSVGIESVLGGFSVCTLSRNASTQEIQTLNGIFEKSGYKGCDLLLTSEWPKDALQLLPENDMRVAQSQGASLSGGSQVVSDLACRSNPRLHFCSGYNLCFERAPYRANNCSDQEATLSNCTFFYSLAGIPAQGSSSEDKSKRWMKAMSCEPMSVSRESKPLPVAVISKLTECPYLDPRKFSNSGDKRPRVDFDNSDASIKRSKTNDELAVSSSAPQPPPGNSSFFFGDMGVPQRRGVRGGGREANNVVTEPPTPDAKSLFVGGLPLVNAAGDPLTEAMLLPIFVGASRIHCVPNKSFAFVDYETHEDALHALQGHVSGKNAITLPSKLSDGSTHVLTIGWGKGRQENTKRAPVQDVIPASHSEDCWFCLASPVVKVHLVVSVAESAYLTLPRGGMADLHVLVVPIECVPNRLMVSTETRRDIEAYCRALDTMYQSMRCRLLCFERAIRTKGKDHMQFHCIPVPFELLSETVSKFSTIASSFKLKFNEVVDSSTSFEDVIMNKSGGNLRAEYFAVDIPVGVEVGQNRRFIYLHDVGTHFKMHFGSEMAATLIGRPDRANWKHCVLDEPDEMKLATKFRANFESFDFTLKS